MLHQTLLAPYDLKDFCIFALFPGINIQSCQPWVWRSRLPFALPVNLQGRGGRRGLKCRGRKEPFRKKTGLNLVEGTTTEMAFKLNFEEISRPPFSETGDRAFKEVTAMGGIGNTRPMNFGELVLECKGCERE